MRWPRNFFQALHGLNTNRGNAILMTLGIIIGIASLTVIVAIGEGTKQKVLNRITSLGFGPDAFSVYAGAGRLFFRKAAAPTTMTFQDVEDIRSLSSVRMAMPRQRKRLNAHYRKQFTNTRVYGVTPDWPMIRSWEVADGRFFDENDMQRKRKVAVIGATPMKNLFGEEDPIGKTVRLDTVFFEIIGVLNEKGVTESGYDPDNRLVIPLPTSASRLLNQTHLHSIRVQAMSPEVVPEAMESVKQILRQNHSLSILADDDFRFVTPGGIMNWVTEQEQTMNRMLMLISAVSLLVGGIVIMNIMLVSIRERIHEIGVRRCFGACRTDITQQFVFESIFVSLLGGLFGVLLGFGLSGALNKFTPLPASVTWEPFAAAFFLGSLIGLVFGIQPARKAAFLSPEETLR